MEGIKERERGYRTGTPMGLRSTSIERREFDCLNHETIKEKNIKLNKSDNLVKIRIKGRRTRCRLWGS